VRQELPAEARTHLAKAVDLLRSGRYPPELAASWLEMAAHSALDADPELGADLLDVARAVRGGGRAALPGLARVLRRTGLLEL
jgi:hypothetical protein